MPKLWRLTRLAEENPFEIALWTLETFGPRQAVAHEQDPIGCCAGIAGGTAHTRNCRERIDPALPEALRFAGPEGIWWSLSTWGET